VKRGIVGRPPVELTYNQIMESHKIYSETRSSRLACKYIKDNYGLVVSHTLLFRRYDKMGLPRIKYDWKI